MQGVLWLSDVNTVDIEKDKTYIIHHILAHGSMEEIWWVMRTYPIETIQNIFRTAPYKEYRAPRFNFIKNYLLELTHVPLDTHRYVTNIPRHIGRE